VVFEFVVAKGFVAEAYQAMGFMVQIIKGVFTVIIIKVAIIKAQMGIFKEHWVVIMMVKSLMGCSFRELK